MKITRIRDGITYLNHNGMAWVTDREIGSVGDRLDWSMEDHHGWVNPLTGVKVEDAFLASEEEEERWAEIAGAT